MAPRITTTLHACVPHELVSDTWQACVGACAYFPQVAQSAGISTESGGALRDRDKRAKREAVAQQATDTQEAERKLTRLQQLYAQHTTDWRLAQVVEQNAAAASRSTQQQALSMRLMMLDGALTRISTERTSLYGSVQHLPPALFEERIGRLEQQEEKLMLDRDAALAAMSAPAANTAPAQPPFAEWAWSEQSVLAAAINRLDPRVLPQPGQPTQTPSVRGPSLPPRGAATPLTLAASFGQDSPAPAHAPADAREPALQREREREPAPAPVDHHERTK